MKLQQAQTLADWLPKELTGGWRWETTEFDRDGNATARFSNVRESLLVLMSVERHVTELGPSLWLHVSLSGRRIPSWTQLVAAKELFMGDEMAVQILPPRRRWVNLHETCLHLWRRLDGPTLSDGDEM